MSSKNNAVPRPLWRSPLLYLFAALLAVYGLAIFLDLPTPAGAKYRQDLSARDLSRWNVQPPPLAQPAAHWWDKAQGLRGWSEFPEGWYWRKIDPAPLDRWIALLALGSLGAFALSWMDRRQRGDRSTCVPWLGLTATMAFAYLLELGTLWLKSPNVQQLLLDRITSWQFTGYFTCAMHISGISALLSNYDSTLRDPSYVGHCRTHPPAPVAFYWLLLQVADRLPEAWKDGAAQLLLAVGNVPRPDLRSAAIVVALVGAHGILLAAAAIVFPLYGLATRLAEPRSALSLAVLGTVLPGLILMSPEFDQLYGTMAATLLLVALVGLEPGRHHTRWGFGAGLLLGFCVFWSFGLWVLAIPMAAMAPLAAFAQLGTRVPHAGTPAGALPIRSALLWLMGVGLGGATFWGTLWGIGGFPLPQVLQLAHGALAGGIIGTRPYVPWLVFSLTDALQFVGLPLAITTLLTLTWPRRWEPLPVAGGFDAVSSYHTPKRLRHAAARFPLALNSWGLLFWGMLLAVNLSGESKAETGRLLIFLSPMALMAVFFAVGRGRLNTQWVYMLLFAQFAVCLFIGGNWFTP